MSRAIALFRSLCTEASPEALAELAASVRAHVDAVRRAQRGNELLALDLAEVLGYRLGLLLDAAVSFEPTYRAMVVGAARYFVSEDDAEPDTGSPLGLDDDVEVFNHVATQLGRTDLLIAD